MFPVQTPLGAWPGLGTQPHYEAPNDLQVENVKVAVRGGMVDPPSPTAIGGKSKILWGGGFVYQVVRTRGGVILTI